MPAINSSVLLGEAQLKEDIEILKKAAAYFARLQE